MIAVPWNYRVVSQRYANVTSIPVVSRIFHKRWLENSRTLHSCPSYLRIDVSLNAIIYLRQNRVPQRGCQTSTLMIYRDPFDSCTNSCNLEAASRGSSIVSPPLRIRFLFSSRSFSFTFSTTSLLTGEIILRRGN